MSDGEFNIPKAAQIALKTFLKMMGFQPEPVIASIEQISETAKAYKADQDVMRAQIDYIFSRLKQDDKNVSARSDDNDRSQHL